MKGGSVSRRGSRDSRSRSVVVATRREERVVVATLQTLVFAFGKKSKKNPQLVCVSTNATGDVGGKSGDAGTRPVRIRACRGSLEARNRIARTGTPRRDTARATRARRRLDFVPRARPWPATRAPMRDEKMKNIARAVKRCFSATEGPTARAYLGLRDLDTVEGGGAEGARGARLGRGDAGREDSDRGDDGSHGCVCWSDECQSRSLLVFWLHSAIFWRDNLKRRKTPATVD